MHWLLRLTLATTPALLLAAPAPPARPAAAAADLNSLASPLLFRRDALKTFYVSPTGHDANLGSRDKPFRSIERARDAVRQVNRNMTGDIVVVLGGGTYRIAAPIVFDHGDSASGGRSVVYHSADGEPAIISGGQPITGWQPDTGGRWKAATSLGNFRQLYVDGKRAVRARGEALPGAELHGKDGYTTIAAAMADWRNQEDIEFCYQVVWCHTRCKVRNIRRQGDRAIVTMIQPHFTHAREKEGVQVQLPSYIENALELLDQPGEWYFDRAAKTVYYKPLPGQDMSRAHVVAPAVEELIELRGTLDQPVENLHFAGITFAEGGWLGPSESGFVDVQANFVLNGKQPLQRDQRITAVHNEQIKSPANVVCHAARGVRFERCVFTRLGGAGLDLEFGSQGNVIAGCHFHDLSGTAVQVGDVLKDDHHPDDPRKIVKNNVVVNNYIHDCCVEYMGGVGVFAGYTDGTVIAHNEICRLPYSGISVGWGWGEEDAGGGNESYYMPCKYATPTPSGNNRVESNHIHHVMNPLQDGGGIYTLGNMEGTVIRGNHIHDNPGVPGGIYLDEGSGFIEVTDNVVYNVRTPMNYNNRAQNRVATCNEQDNFFGIRPGGSLRAPAMTYDGLVLKVYVDGQEAAANQIEKERKAGGTSLDIGRRQDGYIYFQGKIDEVRLYDRALSTEEVKNNAVATGSADSQNKAVADGLVGYWSFDEVPATLLKVERIIRNAGLMLPYRALLEK